ncbi:unnamed protein product (macronuclear) [Paramecium tetraurelia]|uniref:ZZ-type domain-containing protein n=1 Tax=Paramecium tetraurelia TaxID=5888 RepID=A0D7G4_PARTE|nr:uncharacterized protein GSPATT00002023001 [Paramecium tetraurelia]CAK78981.1 unnamed protein product [Paramecium tetraurelia]|eukprot:XP_001446378.1 hypothetical protein (macronuclear) [Paramecium tetraurelia strain d4-2]
MKVKIFLGEYAYIYRGNIDLREMNEYVKTLTIRPFILKWKDQEEDLITISKKQDLVYFYQSWTQNETTQSQPFRLYVQEIPQSIQNTQITQLQSQSHINSKMISPSQKYSCTRQYQGVTQFTFGQQINDLPRSQEAQRERHSQQIYLQSIKEINGSSKNISNQNLDQLQFYNQYNEETTKFKIQQDFNNIPSQDPSSFLNMDMKQSIKNQFIDVQMPNEEEDVLDIKDEEDEEIFDSKNIYCDYCSDIIEPQDEKTILYICQQCEDFHICRLCYDQNQEQVHVHQLKEIPIL